jgi:hypothetical protein
MLFEWVGRYFGTLGTRGLTVMAQLPLSITMLLVVVLAAILHPAFEWSGPFPSTLLGHLLLLAACALVPWERLPQRATLIIPVLDCLFIGLSREAGGQYLTALSFLLVFPIVWLSCWPQRSGVIIAVMAALLSVTLPPAILGTGYTSASFIRIVLLTVILGAMALPPMALPRPSVSSGCGSKHSKLRCSGC